MALLNHNVKIRGDVFQIQTDYSEENELIFVNSNVFQDNVFVWNQKKLFPKESNISIEEYTKIQHKDTMNHLKAIFLSVKKNIDFIALQNEIKDFRKRAGIGLSLIDLFVKDDLSTIANYNRNNFATNMFMDLHNKFSYNLEVVDMKSPLKYYFLMLPNNRAVIVGNINGTNLVYGIIVNLNELPMGMLINLLLPKFLQNVKDELL